MINNKIYNHHSGSKNSPFWGSLGGLQALLVLAILGFTTCKSPESIYEDFVVPNGLIYPGTALNPITRSGDERIEISWNRGTDPRVVKARIFWTTTETDSVEVVVEPDVDIVSAIIENIPENDYSFMIRTYDAEGNRSIPVEVMGKVYGDRYRNTLTNRVLKSALFDGQGNLLLNWHVPVSSETSTSVSYTDINDVKKTVSVSPSDSITLIEDFDNREPLSHVTMHKPDSTALDVFYAQEAATMVKVMEPSEIAKNTWKMLDPSLPTDIAPQGSYPMTGLWNNNIDEIGYHPATNATLPVWFTFDVGINIVVSGIKLWPRGDSYAADDIWRQGHVKEFEVYGSLNPNPDGSWDNSWTLLGECEWPTPGGKVFNVAADITVNDRDIARQGMEFEFVATANADPTVTVRYIRIKVISKHSVSDNGSDATNSRFMISELSLFGIRSLKVE